MIRIFAVDPELVASWHDQNSYRYFMTAFGLGTPRILAQLPDNWKRKVLSRTNGRTEIEKKRIESLALQMTEIAVKRAGSDYDVALPWRDNAEQESTRIPIDLILDVSNFESEFERSKDNKWNLPTSRVVNRADKAMVECLQSLLSNARKISFIDPYFTAHDRFTRPLARFARCARMYSMPLQTKQIEIHTSASYDSAPSWTDFENSCKAKLPGIFSQKQTIKIVRWRQRAGGERLHNRYILTDLGGVQFPKGLDEGSPSETDDLSLLSRDAYEIRWSEYMGPAFGYDIENELIIEGAAPPG